MAACGDQGLQEFGSYTLNALRIEKGYHGWDSDFGSEYTPFACGLERFLAFDKPEFLGRSAVLAERDRDPDWAFRSFEIEGSPVDALPSAPILQEGGPVGYVTSASFDFRCGKCWALGYLERAKAIASAPFEIEILGRAYPTICRQESAYDPNNPRLKS